MNLIKKFYYDREGRHQAGLTLNDWLSFAKSYSFLGISESFRKRKKHRVWKNRLTRHK